MSKNDLFVNPRRQSEYAIIFIILRFLRRIVLQIWPLFIPLFLGRRSSSLDFLELSLYGIGILGIVPSIISYYKFYFRLSDKELMIDKGIFERVQLNIPFERIQSVNFRQTIIHRWCNVTQVEIETAGSSEQETKIDAIEWHLAQKLRAQILERKAYIKSKSASGVSDDISSASPAISEDATKTILRLSLKDLLRVALVQNHLRPLSVLFGGVTTIYFYTFEWADNIQGIIRDVVSFGGRYKLHQLIGIVALLLIGSVLVTIVTTVFRHYNLHFYRSDDRFHIRQGLFTRQEFAAVDKKIQYINWGQNILEKWLGYYKIYFSQATSAEVSERSTQFKIPGCKVEDIAFVFDAWLDRNIALPKGAHAVSIHYFWHTAVYLGFFGAIGIVVTAYLGLYGYLLVICGLLVYLLVLQWIHFKKKKFDLIEDMLYVGGGTIGVRHALLPFYKIQNINISSNPYQWRRGLATLHVHTAGGSLEIPYIKKEVAEKILDFLTYKVESDDRPWM